MGRIGHRGAVYGRVVIAASRGCPSDRKEAKTDDAPQSPYAGHRTVAGFSLSPGLRHRGLQEPETFEAGADDSLLLGCRIDER